MDPYGWHYFTWKEIEDSPSRRDGMTAEEEQICRRSYVLLITEVGRAMGWHYMVAYAGMQLCHRYFALHSFKRNDRYSVALACVYLAGKIMEAPKALREVVDRAERYRHKKYAAEHPNSPKFWEDRAHVESVRDEVLDAERAVLYTIGFNLNISLPYRYLFHYQRLHYLEKDVFTAAWIFINDSAHTQMCLVYYSEEVAVAAIYAALVVLRKELPAGITDNGKKSFCELFNVTSERLQEMLDHLLGMYVVQAKGRMQGSLPADSKASESTAGVALHATSDIVSSGPGSMPQLQGEPGQAAKVAVPQGSMPAAAASGVPGQRRSSNGTEVGPEGAAPAGSALAKVETNPPQVKQEVVVAQE